MSARLMPAQKFDASRLLDAYGTMALELAKLLTALGHAEAVEAKMIAIVDPIYDTATNSTTAWRLVEFGDDMRRITGLPAFPKNRAADG